jgi:putative ABC transport system permease protein
MWLEYFRIARSTLVAHRFRSLLTVLSVTVGAFSIVLMSSLASSGLATLSADVEELGGGRLLYIWPKPVEREDNKLASYSRGLTKEDRAALVERLPHIVEHTTFTSLNRRELVADSGKMGLTDLVGADSYFFEAVRMQSARGRFFTEDENRSHAKLCVVGATVAAEAWDGDAVGHTLTIDGMRCKVIAQLREKDVFSFVGANYPFDWLNLVIMPFETVLESEPEANAEVTLELKLDDMQHSELVKRIANALLLDWHNGLDDFQIFDISKVQAKYESLFDLMKAIVGLIAGIALLVGGMGVMNMMLVSVSERVREIGIRKALGASPADIRRQFLIEAIALTSTGGVVGVAAGVAMAELAVVVIRYFKPSWMNVVAGGAVLVAFAVSVAVGVVFGYFPARRAARMDAIAAIRCA